MTRLFLKCKAVYEKWIFYMFLRVFFAIIHFYTKRDVDLKLWKIKKKTRYVCIVKNFSNSKKIIKKFLWFVIYYTNFGQYTRPLGSFI